ncbi:thioredoxin-like protein [Cladochytrium replicatum]|nr:thioredoxin-like protein [Cladochytrium replicatum]
MTSQVVLHHYPASPFAEKIRLALRLKKIPFVTLPVSDVPPRPATFALTGGFRRIPVLQIDGNIYCDSALILDELDRRFPETTLTPTRQDGASEALSRILGFWTDGPVFKNVSATIPWENTPESFRKDRASLFMGKPDIDVKRAKSGRPFLREQLKLHINLLESVLADGRRWILSRPGAPETEGPTLADVHCAMGPWFINVLPEKVWFTKEAYPKTTDWYARLYKLAADGGIPKAGVGKITEAEALELARKQGGKLDWPIGLGAEDPNDPVKRMPGIPVRVASEDAPALGIEGVLVAMGPNRVAIRRKDDATSIETVVHFPRIGYLIAPKPKL